MFLKFSLKKCMLFSIFSIFYIEASLFDVDRTESRQLSIELERRREEKERLERIKVGKCIDQKKQMLAKIKTFSKEEIEIMGSTLLFESCSVGSFESFVEALKLGVDFKPSIKNTLRYLLNARIEFYKIHDIECYKSLHDDYENLLKYIDYLYSIHEIMKSNCYFPAELNDLILNYSFPNLKEFDAIKKSQLHDEEYGCCIIS